MEKLPIRRSGQAAKINNNLYLLEQSVWQNNFMMYGVDEVGRGCIAGPVVVVAAMLHKNQQHPLLIDSKKLSRSELELMYDWLQTRSIFSVSIGSPRMIDKHNIYQATAQHMRQALLHLFAIAPAPKLIAIDAMPLHLGNTPYADIKIESMIQGESKSASIAAASILAKVTRDRIMMRMEQSFPGYGLAAHKGYCTKLHQTTVQQLRPTVIHRRSFLSWLNKDQTNEQKTIFC